MKNPYHVGVGVAVIVCRTGKILINQRAGAHGANTWAPPGGKLDYGESPETGATREVKEETGLTISDLSYIGFTNDIFEADKLHYITLWYATNKSTGTAVITEPDKCVGQKWCTISDLPEPLFLPTKHILEDMHARNILKTLLRESAA